jgi:hypothetical protein
MSPRSRSALGFGSPGGLRSDAGGHRRGQGKAGNRQQHKAACRRNGLHVHAVSLMVTAKVLSLDEVHRFTRLLTASGPRV